MEKRFVLRVTLVLLFLQGTSGSESEAPWFLGCYNESEKTDKSSFELLHQEKQLTPFYCVQLCSYDENFRYAAVRNGSICFCKASLDHSRNTSLTLCNVSCHGNNNFFCGGTNVSSVYSTAVPVIVSITLNLPRQIRVNASVNATSELSIKRPRGEVGPLGSIMEGNNTAKDILLRWHHDNNLINSMSYTLQGNVTGSSYLYFFVSPGMHSICLRALNLFSSQEICVDVDVFLPVSGLQLVGLYHGSTLLNSSSPLLVTTHETVYMQFLISSGSRPVFRFNFGDGSFPLTVVDTSADLKVHSSNHTCVTASHVFLRCGNFSVNVTVSNAVSQESISLPERFQVQMFIKFMDAECRGRKCIYAEFNSEASLTTKVRQDEGCTVLFEWNFGDSSPNATTTVPSVTHQFQGSQSKYKVTVVASSGVNRKQATIEVCMQERLRGIVVQPGGPLELKTGQDVYFHINTIGNSTVAGFGFVFYFFNKGDGSEPDPVGTGFQIPFNKPGRYIVFGIASNKISRILSNKVLVSVFDPVGQLSIHHEGVTLVGSPTHLVAHLHSGTNVTFHWSFGDELENKTLTNRTVTYTFTRRDKYTVSLLAENDVSSEETSMTLFVTNVSSCYPPIVKILGVFSSFVMRSKEIRLEADVTVNCSISKELVYLWKVIHTSGPKTHQPAVLDGVSVTERVLVIPGLLLDYGFYSLQLEVTLKGTVLATTNERLIQIGPSDLFATIAGGTTRVVGLENKIITLNASGSHDPDYPDAKQNIRFSWSCHLLENSAMPCFNMSKVNKTSSVLSFHMDWVFASAFNGLQFNVTVSKGVRSFSAWQVLTVASGESHVLSADCPQCEKGNISASEQLVMSGFCQSCPSNDSNIRYLWRLYRVGEKNPSVAYECPQVEQSPWKRPEPKVSAVNTQPTIATQAFSSSRKTLDKAPLTQKAIGFRRPTGHPMTSQPTNPSSTPKSQGWISRGRICRDPPQLLIATERPCFPGSGSGSVGGSGLGPAAGTGGSSGSGSGGNSTPHIRWPFGSGSNSGSASGHGPSWFLKGGAAAGSGALPGGIDHGTENNGTLTTNSPSTNFTTPHHVGIGHNDIRSGDWYDPGYRTPSAKTSRTVIGRPRREMKFPVHQTTTGRDRKNLVLKGKFLEGGNIYMLAFSVVDGSNGRKGIASVFFKTNRNPECGTCTVTPSVGVAPETTFQLSCFKWNDEDSGPLTYQVSYSVDGNGVVEDFLIYTGYRSKVSFVLPAGLVSFNQKVKVHVTVVDRLGSRRRIQPLSVRVTRPMLKEGVTMEEILLNETYGRRLSLLLKAGDQQGVRQFSTALAYSLNSLGSTRNVSSKFHLRVQTREELLMLIHKLTVDDKGSSLQTCLALKTLTDKPSELTARGLEIASQILQNLGEMSRLKRLEDRNSLNQAFINSITKITSNLIEGTRNLVQSGRDASYMLHETKRKILVKATETTEKVIKAKLSMQVLGEEGLKVAMPHVRVSAALKPTVSRSLLSLDGVKFQTPEDLDERLNSAGAGSCFETIMAVYKENPFPGEMDHTQVVSLSISSCNGQEMAVRNLSRQLHISIPNPNNKSEERASTFSLKWKHENIHTIQQAEKMGNQTLYIQLKPLSPLPPGFALRVIVSLAGNASSSKSRIVHSSSSFGGVINLYLDKHKLRHAPEALNLSILLEDTAYYRIRQVKRGPSFTYTLSVRWMGCFYWHKGMEQWLTDGCELMQESTVEQFHCRCNHLTAFSGAFVYPPNTFDSKDLADVERLRKSPIAFAVVSVVGVLYLVLLYVCVRADRHDRKKLGAVYIYDYTTAVASQKYQISVETGHWFGAGTSANVFLVLHGEDLVSDPLELKCEGKPLFERSSSDVFFVSAPVNFGPIWKVHIWHDNEGQHPNWFLERVIVKDVKSGVKWSFDCHRWLAVNKGSGKVECVLLASSDKSTSFKTVNVFIMGYVTFSLGCYMVCGSVASLAVGYIYWSCSHLYSFASYDRHYALKN